MPTTTKPRWQNDGSCPSDTDPGGRELTCGTGGGRAVASGVALLVTIAIAVATGTLAAQTPPQNPPASGLEASVRGEPTEATYTLSFVNRSITVFRARVLGRMPEERAAGAVRTLDGLVAQGVIAPVEAQVIDDIALIRVDGHVVFGLTQADIDELSGDTLQGESTQAVSRLQRALEEAREARTPGALFRSALAATMVFALVGLLLWGILRLRRLAIARLYRVAARALAKAGFSDLRAIRATRVYEFERGLVTALIAALISVVAYSAFTFVLRQFPYTRPWGESMRSALLTMGGNLALGIAHAMPGLFTVAVILVLTRFLVRLVGLWFHAVEQGRVKPGWVFPETVKPTRRLLSGLLWIFGLVVAYPHLPGSDSDAFKGISVFLGLMVTLGSSGIVSQIMSGFTLTYSRALRVGDFVRIGDVEGTVVHLGTLSVKLKTLWREVVTIPNAVIVTQNVLDYTRANDTEGVLTRTSVTIGYDTPWRQVQELLLLAAERTDGLRQDPKPRVIQEMLGDFYVQYTLLVCLQNQQTRPFTLDALHAHIQDLFNEYGVQIMSPNYVLDPAAPKVVARKDWFAAPARPPS